MTPTFTVIVPTHDRPAQLARCLDGLSRSTYPRDAFELIVVDDGSPGASRREIAATAATAGARLLRQPHAGPAAARNAGARLATHRYLAFTDDDCVPPPDWLDLLALRVARYPRVVVGGPTVNGLPHDLFAETTQRLVDQLHRQFNVDPDRARFLTSNNLALARDGFLEEGGFDPGFRSAAGEDRELVARLRRRGWQVLFAPEIVVRHEHALTLRSFWRQHYLYGRGAFRLRALERGHGAGVRSERPGFYLRLIGAPLRQRASHRLAFGALLAASQAATAGGFIAAASRAGVRSPSGRRPR